MDQNNTENCLID